MTDAATRFRPTSRTLKSLADALADRLIPDGATSETPWSARAYLWAWRGLRALPASQAYLLGGVAADTIYRRHGVGVQRLELNLGALGIAAAEVPAVTRAGVRSYVRYWLEMFRLPSWSEEQILASVRAVGDEPVRAELASGRGVVMALAHQGNWDVAGAWSSIALAPVTTVAEKLEPPEVYEAFLAFRRSLGMTIVGLGEPSTMRTLTEALKQGHIVPLLADRDLTGSGLPVTFGSGLARMASGPAALADLTGAALVPVSITYEQVRVDGAGWPESGWQTVITFHPEVKVAAGGTRQERVLAATQACADALAAGVRRHPADWHVLQPVFTDVDYPADPVQPPSQPAEGEHPADKQADDHRPEGKQPEGKQARGGRLRRRAAKVKAEADESAATAVDILPDRGRPLRPQHARGGAPKHSPARSSSPKSSRAFRGSNAPKAEQRIISIPEPMTAAGESAVERNGSGERDGSAGPNDAAQRTGRGRGSEPGSSQPSV